MNTAISRTGEVAAYLAGVRLSLTDLPEDARAELLAGLPEHLHEIAAELDAEAGLIDRLGPPDTYAAELRVAAGLPSTVTGPGRAGRDPSWAAVVDGVDHRLGRSLGYDRYSDFVVTLRPAWWVLRGLIVAGSVILWWAWIFGAPESNPAFLFGVAAAFAVSVLLAGISVRLGTWTVAGRRGIGVFANVAALAAFIVLVSVFQDFTYIGGWYY